MLPFYEIIKLESFINKHCHGESKRPNTDNPTFLSMVLLSRNDAGSSELSTYLVVYCPTVKSESSQPKGFQYGSRKCTWDHGSGNVTFSSVMTEFFHF